MTMRDNDLAIAIYTRAITALFALKDAHRIALDAPVPSFMSELNEALGCIERLMLECLSGNPGLRCVSPLVTKLVTEYATREGQQPSK